MVFDGYDLNDLKQCERERRNTALVGDIRIVADSPIEIKKDKFLSNYKNKETFLDHLAKHLNTIGISTKMAKGDADVLIVSTAVEHLTRTTQKTVVVGNDVDLLVLILAHTPENQNLYYFKPGKGNVGNETYSPGICNYILFIHAFSGCDTTLAIYNRGKIMVWNAFINSSNKDIATTFMKKKCIL